MKQRNMINWKANNGKYRKLLVDHLNDGYNEIFDILYRQSISDQNFNFANDLTLTKVIGQVKYIRKQFKYNKDGKVLKQLNLKDLKTALAKTKINKELGFTGNKNKLTIQLEAEAVKKQRQFTFLNKHSKEETVINSTRKSILESLDSKVNSKRIKVKSTKSLFQKKKGTKRTLQHILTDVHLNEVVTRKQSRNNWSTEIGLKTIISIFDQLIAKQKEEKGKFKYQKVELLFLGDLIGTQIHDGLLLDMESIRAAKFLSSIIAQGYKELKKYFEEVRIVLVPGNHSETRLGYEKTDQFSENYDFLVAEYLKEFLNVIDGEDDVISPCRDMPLIAKKLGSNIHGFGHGDRFNTRFKKMAPLLDEYYNIKYLDFFHEGHFHNQKIRYEDGFLKMTYPPITEADYYGQNRFGAFKREPQVGNIYSSDGKLLETYYLFPNKWSQEIKYIKNISFDLDNDISDIFKMTINKLKK